MGGELVKPGSRKAAAYASATATAATQSAAETAARLAEAATQARLLQVRASQIKLTLDDVSGFAVPLWAWWQAGRGLAGLRGRSKSNHATPGDLARSVIAATPDFPASLAGHRPAERGQPETVHWQPMLPTFHIFPPLHRSRHS